MEKIFWGIIFFLLFSSLAIASSNIAAEDPEREKEEFWPPDMVPHPHPPQPSHDDKENWAETK